jgi:hypothetical protein
LYHVFDGDHCSYFSLWHYICKNTGLVAFYPSHSIIASIYNGSTPTLQLL